MELCSPPPARNLSKWAPRVVQMTVPADKLGALIGPVSGAMRVWVGVGMCVGVRVCFVGAFGGGCLGLGWRGCVCFWGGGVFVGAQWGCVFWGGGRGGQERGGIGGRACKESMWALLPARCIWCWVWRLCKATALCCGVLWCNANRSRDRAQQSLCVCADFVYTPTDWLVCVVFCPAACVHYSLTPFTCRAARPFEASLPRLV